MKKHFLLLLLLLPSMSIFAQMGAISPNYSGTTKYFNIGGATPSSLSQTQDTIFVFFEKWGKLTAQQPKGQAARFTWQKLNTNNDPFIFEPFWIDSSPSGNTSHLLDSVGYGCYRVTIDTLQNTTRVAADTFTAWVFIDTFYIDTIQTEKDCNELKMTAVFYPASEGYFHYTYFDLWRAPQSKVERNYPDCGDCYIKKVQWDASVDIHKDTEVENGDAWKSMGFMTFVPTPFYDAKYKVSIENYFGQNDTMSTPLIEAMSTYAKMKLYMTKVENGAEDWVEKTGEEGEESPVTVKLVNTSINANDNATFTWSLFGNLYELPESTNNEPVPVPLIVPQIVTTDSATAVYPKDYDPTLYQPGRYPMALYVVNKHGCNSSDTVKLEVDEFLINKEAVPTVFTPNGDGKNDEFKLKDPDQNVHSLESFEINIFNRYGQLMYSNRNVLFSWDGKMRGTNTIAPDGVYFYVLKAKGLNKQRKTVKQTLKGNVHLFNGR